MTDEERQILNYMKSTPQAYFSFTEISRRAAGKRAFLSNPDWAHPFLPRLVERGLVETDGAGHYRFVNKAGMIRAQGRKWVSPHIAKLLRESGTNFGHMATVEIQEEDAELSYG